MAFIVKCLGAAVRTVSGTVDMYLVPAGKSAIVYSIRLVNTVGATSSALNIFVKPSGSTARRIAKKDDTLASGAKLQIDDVVTLGQGDSVQLDIAPSQPPNYSIEYTVSGVERD